MGHSRPRYNKQREEQMRLRREGKRKEVDHADSGVAEIIIPKTKEEKEADRRLKELQQRDAEANKPMTSKKKKRLESYVNKKLKQERRVDLFKSLAASQDTLTSSLQLQPSSSLGSRQFKTNQDKLDKVSTLSERKRSKVYDQVADKKRGYHSDNDDENGLDGYEGLQAESETPQAGPSRLPADSTKVPPPAKAPAETGAPVVLPTRPSLQPVSLGSALAVGPDGQVIKPVVKQRQKKAPRITFDKKVKPHLRNLGYQALSEGSGSDSSFDSSDSAYDTSSDEEGLGEGLNGGMDSNDEESDEEDVVDDDGDGEEWLGFGGESGAGESIGSQQDDSDCAASEGLAEEDEDEEADSEEEEQDESGEDESEGEDGDALSKSRIDPSAHQTSGKRKRLGEEFKSWANAHLGIETRTAEGQVLPPSEPAVKKARSQEGPLRGPLGEDLVIPASSLLQPSSAQGISDSAAAKAPRKRAIVVDRPEEVQEKRLELPILAEEDQIMEAIRSHSVVVICGETGSGKTTQVPQFLYEAGFGSPGTDNPGIIGVTQPRRVAAMSMATRVGQELALPPSRVSYQIRYDATTSSTTSIKFMTDGVLLRELANDFLLNRYSVIIVDEAHERSVNTDVLIGTLTRVVKLREELWREGKEGAKPLRMIIMSATLRVTDFTENKTLFKVPPPVISVGARQHPVTMHFNRKTRSDYMQEAYSKVSKIHARLPPGGILVFLTGQNEIVTLCKRLEKRFGPKATQERIDKRARIAQGSKAWRTGKKEESEDTKPEADMKVNAGQAAIEPEDVEFGTRTEALAADVDDGIADEDLEALDSDEEYEDDPDGLLEEREEDSDTPMHILPLYSLLPTDKQMRVFQPPPEGHRLVVISTNVAETSLTIPNIRYVVDCGMAKERTYDQSSNIQSFDVSWISKAAASQRAGRAGRTGPGHCYRLYSSNVFETCFPQHGTPEILRTPIEGIVLQMKSMNIDQVVNFPFPTPPDRAGLQTAEKVLINLGALTAPGISGKKVTSPARITELGQAMSLFPLSPRFSKMLVTGQQHGCLPYVIAVVSALSVGDPFLRPEVVGVGENGDNDEDGNHDKQKDDFGNLLADGAGAEIAHIKSEDIRAKEMRKLARSAYFKAQQLHSALGKASSDIFKMLSVVGAYEYEGGTPQFCEKNYVRAKAMQEIHKLRAQITNIVRGNYPSLDIYFDPKLRPPNETQLKVIRQLLTAAFIDQVAIRKDLLAPSTPDYSKVTSTRGVEYQAVGVNETVYIHPSSVLFHNPPPEAVVFQELIRTSKPYIRTVTKINTAWLPTLGKPLCTFSRVLEATPTIHAKARTAGTSTNGGNNTANGQVASNAEERECFVVPKFAGFENLQLPPVKMTQRRIGSRWVFV